MLCRSDPCVPREMQVLVLQNSMSPEQRDGGFVPEPVVGHRTFDRAHAAVVVGEG